MPPSALLAQNTLERILLPAHKRLPEIWKMYKLMEASFWTLEEIDLSQDFADFQKLNAPAQHFLKNVLAFFAVADGLVVENLVTNFIQEMDYIEVRFAYQMQEFMEQIHSEVYNSVLETLLPNEQERLRLLSTALQSDHIRRKTEFCQKFMDPKQKFAVRVLAFCIVEGIHFSASFASIYWLKTKGLMPGVCFSNELIARDEGMHRDLGILIYKKCAPLSESEVHEIVKEGVEIEEAFVRHSIQQGVLGITAENMVHYVHVVADHLLTSMGYSALYKASNPLQFMEMISLQGKTNFFEKRVGEYSRHNVTTGKTSEENFKLDFEDCEF